MTDIVVQFKEEKSMKIIFRKKFKELRNEYADLGENILDIIEDKINTHPCWNLSDFVSKRDQFGRALPFSVAYSDITRSAEYAIKYYKLVKARDNVRAGVTGTALSIVTLGLIGAGIKVSKNNHTLKEEYDKGYIEGRKDQSNDWIEIAEDYNGEKAWLADREDKHIYILASDEETEEYKEYFKNTD